MSHRIPVLALLLLTSVAVSFWAGYRVQEARYEDKCLDLGGGRNPGNHPICVVERPPSALSLGPILVTGQDIVSIKANNETGEYTMVHLVLKPEIAAALNGFTKEAVGQDLPIRIAGHLVNSPRIQEATNGVEMTIALPEEQAHQLMSLLSSEGS